MLRYAESEKERTGEITLRIERTVERDEKRARVDQREPTKTGTQLVSDSNDSHTAGKEGASTQRMHLSPSD